MPMLSFIRWITCCPHLFSQEKESLFIDNDKQHFQILYKLGIIDDNEDWEFVERA